MPTATSDPTPLHQLYGSTIRISTVPLTRMQYRTKTSARRQCRQNIAFPQADIYTSLWLKFPVRRKRNKMTHSHLWVYNPEPTLLQGGNAIT